MVASPCRDFIANVQGSGVAHSFLETEFNQIKCFHLKANIDLVTVKGKSSTYLNKHLIPEIPFHWILLILQRTTMGLLNKKRGVYLVLLCWGLCCCCVGAMGRALCLLAEKGNSAGMCGFSQVALVQPGIPPHYSP